MALTGKLVGFDSSKTLTEAKAKGEDGIIYIPTDADCIVINGKVYGSGTTTNITHAQGTVSLSDALESKASIASPNFTGTPKISGVNIATTEDITAAVGSVYTVKGTKASYNDLPTTDNAVGDVWNVTAAYGNYPSGTNWVWTGTEWDALGGAIDLSGYATIADLEDGTITVSKALWAANASNAVKAEKATKDADGNTISTTYLKTSTAAETYATKDVATTTTAGLMSAADKEKVDNITPNLEAIDGQITALSGKIDTNTTSITNIVGGTTTVAKATNATNATTTNALKNTRYIDGVSFNGNSNIHHYATCETAAATVDKVVEHVGAGASMYYKEVLEVGTRVTVKFSNANTATSPNLKLGDNAYPIYWHGTNIASSQYWQAGAVLDFVLTQQSGNYVWELIGIAKDNNTTYTNAAQGQGYGTCATAAATAAKVVTMSNYTLSTGGIVAVKFTYAVPASATMNINSKGAKPIYFMGAAITANVIRAGDTVTFIYDGTNYHVLSTDSTIKALTWI